MKLILDFDNSIVNTNEAVLKLYREETGDYSTDISQINSWFFDEACPKWSRQKQNEAFINKKLFEVLKPMDNAIEVLERLHKTHTLIICTIHNFRGIMYKSQWIEKYLPFIDSVVYVDASFNGLNKSMLNGDILLDDSIENLSTASVKYPICFGNGGWNKDWTGDRVNNWLEFEKFVDELENGKENEDIYRMQNMKYFKILKNLTEEEIKELQYQIYVQDSLINASIIADVREIKRGD